MHVDTLCNAGHSDGGGGSGMKWRRNDDDERNLIEYDSLAFQAENGKFPAQQDELQSSSCLSFIGSQRNLGSILSIEVHHTSSIKAEVTQIRVRKRVAELAQSEFMRSSDAGGGNVVAQALVC